MVLAFRLSGVASDFPNIAAQREVVETSVPVGYDFRRWNPTPEERLKYFKGEAWGTRGLYISGDKKQRQRSKRAILSTAKSAIASAERPCDPSDPTLEFSHRLVSTMMAGPEWSRRVMTDYMKFLRFEMLEPLKSITRILEEDK